MHGCARAKKSSYVIQDLGKGSRQTIAYEYFERKKWIYDHEKHLRNLEKVAKAQRLDKKAVA